MAKIVWPRRNPLLQETKRAVTSIYIVMESCNGVDREVGAICDKFHLFAASSSSVLAEALNGVEAVKEEMERIILTAAAEQESPPRSGASLTTTQTLVLVKALQSAREAAARVAAEHRDLHSSVSKIGKVIDRNFIADYDSTSRADVFSSPDQQRMLNEVILQHFYRAGQLEIGESLAAEAGLADEHGKKAGKEPFMEMNRILEALGNRDLEPALEWANAHRAELNDRGTTAVSALIAMQQQNNNTSAAGEEDDDDMSANNLLPRSSALEFKLRRLKYIGMLSSGDRTGAIIYARRHFPAFVGSHEREVQSLMGAVMYANGDDPRSRLLSSPYGHLLDDSLWHDMCDLFVKDACALLGLGVESPLSVSVNAGCKTLPGLLNIKQVMQQRQVAGVWNSAKDELPIEIDLGSDCRFHSIFACPILRQQTTDSNPPMRLTCGHCISRDALNKLSSGHKLKCPYCPVEQNPNDARQITF